MTTSENANRRSNARLGLILFGLYSLFYAGFVCISALSADTMDTVIVGGLNLAIIYGFALILLALVMALVFGMVCKPDDDDSITIVSPTSDDGAAKTKAGSEMETDHRTGVDA